MAKKKGLGIIVSIGKGKKGEGPMRGDEDLDEGEPSGFDDACGMLFDAIKADDPEMFKEALRMCLESY